MTSKLLQNKRASLTDPIVGGLLLVVTVITIFSVVTFWNEFKDQMEIEVEGSSSEDIIIADMEAMTEYYTWFDWGIPVVVLALLLTSLIAAFFSGANFIYSIVSILMWAIVMLATYVFDTIFTNYVTYFPTMAASYPIISWVMTNINIISIFWVFLISLIMFLQNRGDSGLKSNISAQSKYYMGTA